MRTLLTGLAALHLVACAGAETVVQVHPLVDAAWLRDNLDEVVVLDIRRDNPAAGSIGVYSVGHIPGAVQSPYGVHPWLETRDGVPGMMPAVEKLESMLGALGISNDDHVVIVAAGLSAIEFGAATRVYWQFKVLGHERVSILNGGYSAWRSAGYAVEAGRNTPSRTTYRANLQPHLVASTEDVRAAIENGTPIIDARSANYYMGAAKISAAARYGTIAGAVNVPQENLTVGNGGMFIDAETATSIWSAAGLPTGGKQIAFCNIGHLASLAWFAAYEVLDNKEARLYDGSMVQWSANPELPMDNTDNPNRQ